MYFAVGGTGGRGGGRGAPPPAAGQADNSANGLFSVGIDGRDRRRIAGGTFSAMQPTADRRAIYFRGQPPTRLTIGAGAPAGGGSAPTPAAVGRGAGEPVSFAFKVRVDRRKEWEQIFDESYRVMKYRFYDPKMHGKDWAAIRAKYEPLLKYAGTNEDVYDITNAAIGELSASHTSVSGPPTVQTVSRDADGANPKTYRIASTNDLTNLKYEEWVANNRDSVDKATAGQIAYVHIRSMNQPSLDRFRNEIDRFWQKKGIIVDIRDNGGGNIDQELIDILERQPYQFCNNRNGARWWYVGRVRRLSVPR